VVANRKQGLEEEEDMVKICQICRKEASTLAIISAISLRSREHFGTLERARNSSIRRNPILYPLQKLT
jgi:hypothetical protein